MHAIRILAAAATLAAATALPLQAQGRIAVGQTLRGTLSESSPTLDDGSHYATYTIAGTSGQTVTITLRSEDFDAYLSVGRMSGGEYSAIETDDDGAGGTDAQVTLTFPSTGSYVIRANTLSEGETGDFTLQVAAGGGGGGGGSNNGGGASNGGGMVGMLLDSAVVMMRNASLNPRGGATRGALASGASRDISVTLQAGEVFAFLGVCDQSCSDLDMTVYGPDGNEVGSDVLPDDAPIVRVDNPRAGTYRVRVTMATCSASTCEFGMRVMGK
jgi:hypothetical protein